METNLDLIKPLLKYLQRKFMLYNKTNFFLIEKEEENNCSIVFKISIWLLQDIVWLQTCRKKILVWEQCLACVWVGGFMGWFLGTTLAGCRTPAGCKSPLSFVVFFGIVAANCKVAAIEGWQQDSFIIYLMVHTSNKYHSAHRVLSVGRAPQKWCYSLLHGTRLPLGQLGARQTMDWTVDLLLPFVWEKTASGPVRSKTFQIYHYRYIYS